MDSGSPATEIVSHFESLIITERDGATELWKVVEESTIEKISIREKKFSVILSVDPTHT